MFFIILTKYGSKQSFYCFEVWTLTCELTQKMFESCITTIQKGENYATFFIVLCANGDIFFASSSKFEGKLKLGF